MAKRIKTVNKEMLKKTLRSGGCGECPACQSACKNVLHGRQPGLRKRLKVL